MVRAFVFPGQGAQAVGMGKELAGAFPAAKHVFQEIDDALERHLSRLMFEGPEEELVLTENAQPALMAVSMAVFGVLTGESNFDLAAAGKFVAGHSLGEYTALTAAGAFQLADAARIVKTRGQAMQAAVPVGEGAMAALLGVELDQAQDFAARGAEGGVCTTGNDNAPGQVVISGDTAAEVTEPEEIRRLLIEQVTSLVRWRECVLYMRDNGVDTVVEIGAGKVLTGLSRRIDRDLTGISVQTPDDIESFAATL